MGLNCHGGTFHGGMLTSHGYHMRSPGGEKKHHQHRHPSICTLSLANAVAIYVVTTHVIGGKGLHPIDQRGLLDDIDLGRAEGLSCMNLKLLGYRLSWMNFMMMSENLGSKNVNQILVVTVTGKGNHPKIMHGSREWNAWEVLRLLLVFRKRIQVHHFCWWWNNPSEKECARQIGSSP